jgi:hypothetical protein
MNASPVARALALLILIGTCLVTPLVACEQQAKRVELVHDEPVTASIRGRIVWLAEAQERLHGVKSVPEARENVIALETPDGELFPLVEDVRGRAFRRDERLRNLKDCELVVRRFSGSPMVQIIHVYSHEDDVKFELDYFCEICAITMFELKPCDCCQGEIELRRREVE